MAAVAKDMAGQVFTPARLVVIALGVIIVIAIVAAILTSNGG